MYDRSKTRKIYRVENSKGAGPYRKTGSFPHHNKGVTRPAPWSDKELGVGMHICDDWRFGFTSQTQLLKWFSPSDRKELHNRKFKITIYEVVSESIKKSSKQAIFRRKYAKKIGDMIIDSNGDIHKVPEI